MTLSKYTRRDRLKVAIARKTGRLKDGPIGSNDNFRIVDLLSRTDVLFRSASLDQASFVETGAPATLSSTRPPAGLG